MNDVQRSAAALQKWLLVPAVLTSGNVLRAADTLPWLSRSLTAVAAGLVVFAALYFAIEGFRRNDR